MARPPAALPVALRSRPFTVAEAAALKVPVKRLRAADLRAPYRGVRVSTGVAWTPAVRARCAMLAAQLAGSAQAVLTGAYAVDVWQLPTPFGARDPLLADPVVAVPRGGRRPRCAGLVVRPWGLHPQTQVWVVATLRVLSPEDLWAERCAELDPESAVALGDAVLRRLQDDRPRMRAALQRLPLEQQPAASAVLELVRYAVFSPVETRVRLLLRRAGVPEPSHYSQPVPREGRAQVWPDLQWESVKVAVEIDGPHHRDQAQQGRDVRRDRRTRRHGWTQLVFTSTEVMREPDMVVREIAAELRRAGLRW